MKFFNNVAIAFVFVLSTLTSQSAFAQESEAAPTAQAETRARPQDAPQWTLKTQDGKEVSYSDYEGTPMMITFWGTWCPYCKKLHPGLEKIRAEYESQGLVILGISVNEEPGAKPQTDLKKRGINFLTLVDGDNVAIDDFEVAGTPTTVFVSAKGQILGSTMESNPDDPRFKQIAEYLVNNR